MAMVGRITYTRHVENKIAKALHNKLRRELHLEKDYDPKTGEYLEQPEYLKPNYMMQQDVAINILADHNYELPSVNPPAQTDK